MVRVSVYDSMEGRQTIIGREGLGFGGRGIGRAAFDFAAVLYSITRSRRLKTRDGYETGPDNLAGDRRTLAMLVVTPGGQGALGSRLSLTPGLNT